MPFLLFLRDRVLPYLLLLCIIVGGIGGIGWLLARTYFWNTSGVTFIVDEEIIAAQISIKARIIYKDFRVFGNVYSFHIVLPYNHTVSCIKECAFSDIPAGNAEIVLYTKDGIQWREEVLITADTMWTIDLRLPIRLKEIVYKEVDNNIWSVIDSELDMESVFYRNTVQGLWLFYDKGIPFIYDIWSRQKILLENKTRVRSVVRWIEEGVYYLMTENNEVMVFDRYGRRETVIIDHSSLDGQDIVWEIREGMITSKLVIQGEERVFPGRLFWLIDEEKSYLFDGEKVFEIINN